MHPVFGLRGRGGEYGLIIFVHKTSAVLIFFHRNFSECFMYKYIILKELFWKQWYNYMMTVVFDHPA